MTQRNDTQGGFSTSLPHLINVCYHAGKKFNKPPSTFWAIAYEGYLDAQRLYRAEKGAWMPYVKIRMMGQILDHMRKVIRHQVPITTDESVYNYCEDKPKNYRLKYIIEKLPQKDRDLLMMNYFEGLTLKELGYMMDKTESAVSFQLTRIRKKLRDLYKVYDEVGL